MLLKSLTLSLLGLALLFASGCQLAEIENERDRYRSEAERLQGDLDHREHELNKCAGERASLSQRLEGAQKELLEELENNRMLRKANSELEKEQLTHAIEGGQSNLGSEFDDIAGVNVSGEGGEIHLQLDQSILFGAGKVTVSKAGIRTLNEISKILRSTYAGRRVQVEGHTDNVPVKEIKKRIPSNWELSCLRACAVLRQLISKKAVDPLQATAIGYADSRPLASNRSAAGRKQNRRVEIIILP